MAISHYLYSQVTDTTQRKHTLWRFLTALQSDSKLRPVLNLKGVVDTSSSSTSPSLSAIVDWFYAIQGIVAAKIELSDQNSIAFIDNTDLPIPISVLAISSLFDHLSMVEQVLGISFSLPVIHLILLNDTANKYLSAANFTLNNNLLLNETVTTTPINLTLNEIKAYLTERMGVIAPFPDRPSIKSNGQVPRK